MAIVIREADIDLDRQILIDFLYQHLTKQSNDRRFDWLYRNNPHGQARVWIAMDTDCQGIIGVASAFPRRMYVGQGEELGWVLGDFCIRNPYRSLGPALQLQRACLREVDSGNIGFCYDFPSTKMMVIYKRLGISPFGQMLRLAKPLRVDRKVKEMVKTQVVAQGLSAIGNFLLMLQDRRSESSGTLMISLQKGECGEEFSALAQEVGGRYGICIQRSAEYLNWRYLANPLCHYELLTARRDGILLAYAVFTHVREDAILVDLFGIEEPDVLSKLVDRLVTLLRKRGVITVSIPIVESHPWIVFLQRLGFQVREASPIAIYASPHSPLGYNRYESPNWFLMQGDRDS